MPFYDFECDRGHVTEQRAGVEERFRPCRCGLPAERLYALPSIHTGNTPITDGFYKNEADKKALKRKGWDGDRAIEHLRKHRVETASGWGIDMTRANGSN